MGLSDEEINGYDSVEDMLEEQAEIFAALKDPLKQTAVVNMDGAALSKISLLV